VAASLIARRRRGRGQISLFGAFISYLASHILTRQIHNCLFFIRDDGRKNCGLIVGSDMSQEERAVTSDSEMSDWARAQYRVCPMMNGIGYTVTEVTRNDNGMA
jgi:hypothetical protein